MGAVQHRGGIHQDIGVTFSFHRCLLLLIHCRITRDVLNPEYFCVHLRSKIIYFSAVIIKIMVKKNSSSQKRKIYDPVCVRAKITAWE